MTMHLWWCRSWIENESTCLLKIQLMAVSHTSQNLISRLSGHYYKVLMPAISNKTLVMYHLLTSSLVAHVHSSYTTYVHQSTCVVSRSEVTQTTLQHEHNSPAVLFTHFSMLVPPCVPWRPCEPGKALAHWGVCHKLHNNSSQSLTMMTAVYHDCTPTHIATVRYHRLSIPLASYM